MLGKPPSSATNQLPICFAAADQLLCMRLMRLHSWMLRLQQVRHCHIESNFSMVSSPPFQCHPTTCAFVQSKTGWQSNGMLSKAKASDRSVKTQTKSDKAQCKQSSAKTQELCWHNSFSKSLFGSTVQQRFSSSGTCMSSCVHRAVRIPVLWLSSGTPSPLYSCIQATPICQAQRGSQLSNFWHSERHKLLQRDASHIAALI